MVLMRETFQQEARAQGGYTGSVKGGTQEAPGARQVGAPRSARRLRRRRGLPSSSSWTSSSRPAPWPAPLPPRPAAPPSPHRPAPPPPPALPASLAVPPQRQAAAAPCAAGSAPRRPCDPCSRRTAGRFQRFCCPRVPRVHKLAKFVTVYNAKRPVGVVWRRRRLSRRRRRSPAPQPCCLTMS